MHGLKLVCYGFMILPRNSASWSLAMFRFDVVDNGDDDDGGGDDDDVDDDKNGDVDDDVDGFIVYVLT